MEEIEHKHIEVNGGLKLHVAEIGSSGTRSTAVVFLHGFPEIWYSWRHQMIAVAKAGFRAIAFDYRGYGLSDLPPQPEKTTFLDLVSDLLALLDALHLSKVFLVGKDFGSLVASLFLFLHPDRVLGFATLGIPILPPRRPAYHNHLPEGFYVSRWREPGRAEADFGRFDATTVVKNVYILFSKNEIPIASENQEIMDLVEPSTPLPSWLTNEDLATYGALYEKSGFQTPLQVPYRSFGDQQAFPDGTDPKVELPGLLIMGEKDYVFKFPGMEDYIRSGKMKDIVPNLEIIYLPEGNHFVQEQFPEELARDGRDATQVFLVGRDFGVWPACPSAILQPGRVAGLVTTGIPYFPRPQGSFLVILLECLYIPRWQEPGRAEADLGRFDAKTVVRNVYILFSRSELPIAAKDKESMDLVGQSHSLQSWLTEEDLNAFAALYQKSGFSTALKVPYRSLHEECSIMNPKVEIPALVIMGGKDYALKFPGVEDFLKSEHIKASIPNLQMIFLPEGSHFVQEQFPDEVNRVIISVLHRHY